VSEAGNYTVTIIENNCPVISNTITIGVTNISAPILTSSGNITACDGGSVIMDAGSGYDSYLWSSGGTSQTETVQQGGTYTVAVSLNGCIVSSDDFEIIASSVNPVEICLVGINSVTNTNEIVWEKPVTNAIESFLIYKESSVANQYDYIGSVDYDQEAIFNDLNSYPAIQSYQYKIAVQDTCGNVTTQSEIHKTIHLTINQGQNDSWNLIWNHYEGFTFGTYNVYRGTDASNLSFLTSLASSNNSYTDFTPPTRNVYYQIEVMPTSPCDPTKALVTSSRSNIISAQTADLYHLDLNEMKVYPNPTNGIVNVVMDEVKGRLMVFNSLGQMVIDNINFNHKEIIDLSSFRSGVYTFVIETENGIERQQIIYSK
jgi:trimeric autotransporter adhesin